jgi:hypothetical protein
MKFKVGDRVRVITAGYSVTQIGSEGIVIELAGDGAGQNYWSIKFDKITGVETGSKTFTLAESSLALVPIIKLSPERFTRKRRIILDLNAEK